MANQSAAAVAAFRKKLQAATRQAARNPDQLKKVMYGLKNEWVQITSTYPEVDRVGNAQYLRALLKPGAMQYSGDDAQQYLDTQVSEDGDRGGEGKRGEGTVAAVGSSTGTVQRD